MSVPRERGGFQLQTGSRKGKKKAARFQEAACIYVDLSEAKALQVIISSA